MDRTAPFLALYERTVDRVYSYLASRLGDRAVAEDLTQDVFIAALGRARGGLDVDVAWLLTVARNKLVDHWRAAARREARLAVLAGGSDGSVASAEPLDPGRAEQALGELSATYRLALVLRHVDGLSVPEVARHLGRTVEATEQVLTRARTAFRRVYQEQS